jgi:hypothetical protein
MKKFSDYANWTLHHTWTILLSYFISMVALLLIHGAFGFTMADFGTYLSNPVMHIASGAILAFGTGVLQRVLLKRHIRIPFFWVVSLVIGFVIAETAAGIVLWKMEIYRGLINIFNTDVHYPKALIFALAGLIAGAFQIRLLKPTYTKRFYWILTSTLGWAVLILSTYLSPYAFVLGALFYGAITGLAFYRLMEPKTNQENLS